MDKILSIGLWVAFSSGYLYLMNMASFEGQVLKGYIYFTFMLIGGGISYDIAAKMFAMPSNHEKWKELNTRLILVILFHFIVLGGIFLAGYLSGCMGVAGELVGIAISLVAVVLACHNAYRAEQAFKSIK